MFNLNPIKMKTQELFYDCGYGIDVRDMARVTLVLSEIFTKLTDEERIAYAALNLCETLDPVLVRYDHDLCDLCVGPIVIDKYNMDAQCSKFFISLISRKNEVANDFRECVVICLNVGQPTAKIRENMLLQAKNTLESNMIEGFC